MANEPPRTLLARAGEALTPTVGDLAGTIIVGATWWASGFNDPDTLQDAYTHFSNLSTLDPKLLLTSYLAGVGALTRYGTNVIVRDAFGPKNEDRYTDR